MVFKCADAMFILGSFKWFVCAVSEVLHILLIISQRKHPVIHICSLSVLHFAMTADARLPLT